MKGHSVCTIIVVLSSVSAVFGAVGLGRATVHESHPDKCYEAKSASYFSPGESWPMEGTCGKVTCEKMSSSSAQLMISFATCGVAMVQPPCYLVEDKTKPYPDCCPQAVCPETADEELSPISEENAISASNETAESVSPLNQHNVAMHFSLGRMPSGRHFVERNDLDDEQQDDSSEQSFEVIQPRLIPPNFQYASFDDIDSDHDRFNEIDQGDYQMV